MIAVKKGKVICCLLCIACIFLAAGCGYDSSTNDSVNDDQEQDQLEDDPALGLSVNSVEMKQRILVDRSGYGTDSDKKVIFVGDIQTETFEVRNISDDRMVYSGSIRSKKSSNGDEKTGIGDFTGLKQDGDYYIYVKYMGKSYPFCISKDIYDSDESIAFKAFYYNRCGISTGDDHAGDLAHDKCHSEDSVMPDSEDGILSVTGGWHLDNSYDRSVTEGSDIICNLLTAYEINKDFFTDKENIPESGNDIPDILDEVKYETDWMMKMQKKDGSVYEEVLTDREPSPDYNSKTTVQPVTPEATIKFAAAEAKMAYNYRKYNSLYSDKCKEAAESAYKQYAASGEDMNTGFAFHAAAELYRLTGKSEYSKVLSDFFRQKYFTEKMKKDKELFYGVVTYLSINGKVDREICDLLMKTVRSHSSDILNEIDVSGFNVSCCSDCIDSQEKLQQMILDMKYLAVTNHIIYNNEYISAIENGVHYLLGRNPGSVNLLDEEYDNIYDGQMMMNSDLIVMLSAL